MFVLFTDFGYQGPYVGQMKAVLTNQAPGVATIDLMHDAPLCNPKASAYLLASLIPRLPLDVVVIGVVDPGVGDPERRPIVLRADGRWYVGPDNALFEFVARHAHTTAWWEIAWRPHHLSNTFHGRDLFAPIAAHIAVAGTPSAGMQPIEPVSPVDWPDDLPEVIYIDGFGNAITGLRAESVATSRRLSVNGTGVDHAPTFSSVPTGRAFWYVNSNDLVEIAVNQGSAAALMSLNIGTDVRMGS